MQSHGFSLYRGKGNGDAKTGVDMFGFRCHDLFK